MQIIITIGKWINDDQIVTEVIDSGVDGYRINTGRASYTQSLSIIQKLIEKGVKPESIYLDVFNSKARLFLNKKEDYLIKANDKFTISSYKNAHCDAYIDTIGFSESIKVGDELIIGDGELICNVISIDNDVVTVLFNNDGILTNNTGIRTKDRCLKSTKTKQDELIEIQKILDIYPINIIVSFIETVNDYLFAIEHISRTNSIVPKIETRGAVNDFLSICDIAKRVFIGRGDLALSVGIEKIGAIQNELLTKAKNKNVKVDVGTGLLKSLLVDSYPARSEVIDISNCYYSGVNAIVLTDETAKSDNPRKVIDWAKKIVRSIEEN